MDPLQAILLGIFQGVLEWLPVSSQGLSSILMTEFLGMAPETSDSAAVFLHSGTALSAAAYFRKEFIELFKQLPGWISDSIESRNLAEDYKLMNFLFVASAFSGVSGLLSLLTKDFIFQNIVSSSSVFTGLIGVALVGTGILKLREEEGSRLTDSLNFSDGAVAGFLQGFAFIPGISRSGITVFGLFLRDFSAEDAFRLSFLMSVPAVLMGQVAIGVLKGFIPTPNLILAGLVAFVSGLVSIDLVLRIARRIKVEYICFGLAAIIFAFLAL